MKTYRGATSTQSSNPDVIQACFTITRKSLLGATRIRDRFAGPSCFDAPLPSAVPFPPKHWLLPSRPQQEEETEAICIDRIRRHSTQSQSPFQKYVKVSRHESSEANEDVCLALTRDLRSLLRIDDKPRQNDIEEADEEVCSIMTRKNATDFARADACFALTSHFRPLFKIDNKEQGIAVDEGKAAVCVALSVLEIEEPHTATDAAEEDQCSIMTRNLRSLLKIDGNEQDTAFFEAQADVYAALPTSLRPPPVGFDAREQDSLTGEALGASEEACSMSRHTPTTTTTDEADAEVCLALTRNLQVCLTMTRNLRSLLKIDDKQLDIAV